MNSTPTTCSSQGGRQAADGGSTEENISSLGKRIQEIPPAVLQIHSSLHQTHLFSSLPDPGKPHAEEASAQEKNSCRVLMSLPFVSALSLLFQTLVPVHDGIFMKDTDLFNLTLERPTMLLCQTTTKSNL